MRTVIHTGTILFLMALGCVDRITEPQDDTAYLRPDNLIDLTYSPVDYNTLRVSHRLGDTLSSLEVERIDFGVIRVGQFVILDSSVASFPHSTTEGLLRMSAILHLDYTRLAESIRTRFLFRDGSYSDVDTSVATYIYPYLDTKLVLTMDVFGGLPHPPQTPQDIARIDNILYVHPIAAFGLYSFDLVTGQVAELLQYGSGDNIASDSIYVFCDVEHRRVRRFNTLLNQVDLEFPDLKTLNIHGMSAADGSVFVLVANGYLKRFTLDGVFVDSSYFPQGRVYLTQHQTDFWVYDETFNTLNAYDRSAWSLVAKYLAPAANGTGIRVHDDALYFADFDKRAIFRVPVAALKSVP